MKPAQLSTFDLPANHANAGKNAESDSEISGYVFHPIRRASDTCPLSRIPFGSEYPPTSPKIHELRERNAAQLAEESRASSRASE
jgi:hypothetical protein